jgi:hypothetical protein
MRAPNTQRTARRVTAELLHLVSKGWSDRRIAKHFGKPHGTIHSRRKTLKNRAAMEPLPKIEFPPPGHCLFPNGDMPALTFCGATVEGDGKPYCRHHARKAYLPPKAVDMRLVA